MNELKIFVANNKFGVRYSTGNHFLSEDFIIKVYDDKIVFKRTGVDWVGKSHKLKLSKRGLYTSYIAEQIPIGIHYLDLDESDEDQLVFYFNTEENV